MNALDQLPLDAVLPLSDSLLALASDIESQGIPVATINLEGAASKRAKLEAVAHALGFPDYFGGNYDALYESLGELEPGRLIVIRGLGEDPEGLALLAVFRDVAREFGLRGQSLRVFYD